MVDHSFTTLKLKNESDFVMRRIALVWLVCCMMSGVVFASSMQDPTEPPDMNQTSATAWKSNLPKLQSILRSPDYQGAMLNGRMVQVGGYSGRWRLVSVEAGFAVIAQNGQRRKLFLYPQLIETRNKKSVILDEKAK